MVLRTSDHPPSFELDKRTLIMKAEADVTLLGECSVWLDFT